MQQCQVITFPGFLVVADLAFVYLGSEFLEFRQMSNLLFSANLLLDKYLDFFMYGTGEAKNGGSERETK